MPFFIFPQKDKEVRIPVAPKILNTYAGFSEIISLYDSCKDCFDQKIVFDFSKTKYIDANLSAVVGAIFVDVLKRHNDIEVVSINTRISEILYKNGFMDFFNFGKHDDTYETTVKFCSFGTAEKESFQDYLDRELFPKITISMTQDYKDYLSCNLDEVYQNARQHGNTDRVYACGQWFPKDNKLKFTLSNMGTTIPENVRTVVPVKSDSRAIEWATKEGTTTKPDKKYGGRGLFDLQSFIEENKGRFHIISGNGYWGISNGDKKTHKEYEKKFPGTIINLEINLNDKHTYDRDFTQLLNSDEIDLEKILFE